MTSIAQGEIGLLGISPVYREGGLHPKSPGRSLEDSKQSLGLIRFVLCLWLENGQDDVGRQPGGWWQQSRGDGSGLSPCSDSSC